MRTGRALAVLAAVSAVAAAAVTAPAATAAGPRLGPTLRIRTPGESRCPVESEPDVVVTRAGTWVAYNDMHQCWLPVDNPMTSAISLQLVPAGGGAPRHVRIPPRRPGEFLNGDPALAPDPRGDGVILASLQYSGWYTGDAVNVETYRVDPSLRVTRLPSPALGTADEGADKEFIATDTSPRSRYRGRLYAAWDNHSMSGSGMMFRAFDGRRWGDAMRLGHPGHPDVAVAPNGDVAVAWEVFDGVAVRISKDGGRTFAPEKRIIGGYAPGRYDPACPLQATVGVRQRATKSVRATYDAAGRLHVVAATGNVRLTQLDRTPQAGVATGGIARLFHASSVDGRSWRTFEIGGGESDAQRFHPVVAPAADGGVAVAWLETTGVQTYDAYVAFARAGSTAFGPPVRLSDRSSAFLVATEAMLTTGCYGIGDYIGLAATARGVVAAWPTTDGTTNAVYDTDVLLREVSLR